MQWLKHYQPPTLRAWQGRNDAKENTYLFQKMTLLDLKTDIKITAPGFVFLGFCCDEGVKRNLGRVGAKEGPEVIRSIAAKLPLHRDLTCYDAGNILCDSSDLESAQQALAEAISLLLENNLTPIILGGGHEIAYGHFLGIQKNEKEKNIGIINFDAHFDMRPLLAENKGSSGTPFLQIANTLLSKNKKFSYLCLGIQKSGNTKELFQTAEKYHVDYLLAENMLSVDEVKNKIDHALKNDCIYTTICLDVFSSACAPGVSAPQPLGLTPNDVVPALRQIASSGKVKSYDLAEYAPCFDRDNLTAKLAAQLIFEILHHHKK